LNVVSVSVYVAVVAFEKRKKKKKTRAQTKSPDAKSFRACQKSKSNFEPGPFQFLILCMRFQTNTQKQGVKSFGGWNVVTKTKPCRVFIAL
jgi:hypothetical protein